MSIGSTSSRWVVVTELRFQVGTISWPYSINRILTVSQVLVGEENCRSFLHLRDLTSLINAGLYSFVMKIWVRPWDNGRWIKNALFEAVLYSKSVDESAQKALRHLFYISSLFLTLSDRFSDEYRQTQV